MKERGKSVEPVQDYNNFCSDYNYYYSSSSSDLPCKKHPSNSSSVGICAHCLKDRLMKLVCSDCGEQRLSSCSCSDVSSYRNSSCTVDVGSVGRISFLIENENEQKTLFSHIKQARKSEPQDVVVLKRSNSCVVEVKKGNGLWRIGKFFKKKRGKGEGNRDGFDEKSEACCVSDCVMNVSRSRSLCSFRGGNFEHEVGSVSDMGFSSAKVSDFNESEPRKSGFRGGFMDDDSGFIDLKLDFWDKSRTDHSVFKKCDVSDFDRLKGEMFVGKIGSQRCLENCGNGMGSSSSSSSCRITVNERGIKKGRNGHGKVWKWIFRHHSGKKDLNHILES